MQKSISAILIFALFIVLFFNNCSDSTSDDEASLIGTWELNKITIHVPLNPVIQDPNEEGYSIRLIIRDDNTYIRISTFGDIPDTVEGTWSISETRLTYTEGDETIEVEYKLKGDTFEIIREVEYFGYNLSQTEEYIRQ